MDITFNCDKCGQPLTIDAAGAGASVPCPKCQAALVVPSVQAEQSPVRQGERLALPPRKPKRRLGLVLGIVGLMLVFLAILCVVLAPIRRFLSQDTLAVAQTRGDVVKQLDAVIRRFAGLSPASPDFDSVEFDVEPSPSGSIVSPYIGRVEYVMPAQVSSWCWNSPTSDSNPKTGNCRVHLRVWFAYQDAVWVFKELKLDENRAWSECHGCPSFSLTKESQALLEQHRKRWQTATAR